MGLDDLRRLASKIDALRALAEDIRRYGAAPNDPAGFTALFAGECGTGKTLAAEAVAHQLGSDIHLVDLVGIVNEDIGETEKNLRRLFDAAAERTALLYFDEADALFGKRTANIEVNEVLDLAARAHAVSIFSIARPFLPLGPELGRRVRAQLDFDDEQHVVA
jgi:SpoVK/Ycf46/Vps4 family AAA+-type ATPase